MLVTAGTLAGCSVDSLVDVKRPSGILDPDALKTYDGAIGMYNGAVSEFNRAFMGGQQPSGAKSVNTGPFVIASGVLADEYTLPSPPGAIDRRADEQGIDGASTYPVLAIAYLAAGQAIQYLQAYAENAPKAYVARMHLNRGYISLFMSELFCSGVPLSEAGTEGKVVYGTGLSTDSLQHYALAQFDSALSIFGQDTGVIAIAARMGRARAFLNLKEYDKAATEVANVSTDFRYDATYNSSVTVSAGFFQPGGPTPYSTVADNEGQNGLNFVSTKDPRVQTDKVSRINQIDIYQPHAWRASGSLNVPIESGINARLIEAEYLLSQGKVTEWLAKLNALRTTCASAVGCATPAPAGDGGVAGLPPLTDPGTPASRLQLLLSERGFWLFGTGHRQGDLRRLVRQYNIPQSQVYPTGAYIELQGTLSAQGMLYGIYTNIGLGAHELEANPNYQGCFDREA